MGVSVGTASASGICIARGAATVRRGVCGSGPACLIGCDARSMHRRPERDRPAWAMGGGTRQRHRRCLARVALGRRGCAAQAPQARLTAYGFTRTQPYLAVRRTHGHGSRYRAALQSSLQSIEVTERTRHRAPERRPRPRRGPVGLAMPARHAECALSRLGPWMRDKG